LNFLIKENRSYNASKNWAMKQNGKQLMSSPTNLSDTMAGVTFSIDMNRFKALGIIDPNSKEALDAFNHHEFSSAERLFFKLWGSDLPSAAFHPGQKLVTRGEHPVSAYVVISGVVEITSSKGKFLFGPGSVFGLAEGMADTVNEWDAEAKSLVVTKMISIDRALREVRRLNAGLKGICRFTTMRILGLKTAPASLS
jgi:Cyclic nucleotide-binding domain